MVLSLLSYRAIPRSTDFVAGLVHSIKRTPTGLEMTAHRFCQVQDACANGKKPIDAICKGIIGCRKAAGRTEASNYYGGAVVGVDVSAFSPPGEEVGQ